MKSEIVVTALDIVLREKKEKKKKSRNNVGKSSEWIVRYNWAMSAHASQAFSIAHCTDSEDLPPIHLWV